MTASATASLETVEGFRVIVLREPATGSEAHVVADVGSNLARFRTTIDGRELALLAEAPDMSALLRSPTRYGSGPLFPYPGRVVRGRFAFQGRQVELPKEPDGDAIHGLIRARPFEVVSIGDAAVTTRLDSRRSDLAAVDWPFPFVYTHTTSLRAGAVRTEIEVTNVGSTDLPMGVGFHPYFPASPDHRVWVDADERWEQVAPAWPTGRVEPETELRSPRPLGDVASNIEVADGAVRNILLRKRDGGISAGVEYSDAGYVARLTSSPEFRDLVLFASARPVVGLEPRTCVPNALNMARDGGLIVLGPGEHWRGWYQMDATPL